MTRRNVSGINPANVANAATMAIAYPPGMSRGDFMPAYDHQLFIGSNVYKIPSAKVSLTFGGANGIVVTNNTGAQWDAGLAYTMSYDVPGSGAGWPTNDGKAIIGDIQDWPTVLLNLGSPLALNAAGLRVSAAVAAAGSIGGLLVSKLDCPRNVTIACAGADAARVFTVRGNDIAGNAMTENIAGSAAGSTAGKKAFATVRDISADAACAGNVGVGWGNVLGLPCFVPSAVFVQKEFQDLVVAGAGAFIYGDQTPPTATTGDVAGTYVPAVAPDGLKAYGILVCLPDPGYRGADQFAG
jgi:hypothetical protein